jgi:hypothetical protein
MLAAACVQGSLRLAAAVDRIGLVMSTLLSQRWTCAALSSMFPSARMQYRTVKIRRRLPSPADKLESELELLGWKASFSIKRTLNGTRPKFIRACTFGS